VSLYALFFALVKNYAYITLDSMRKLNGKIKRERGITL